MTEHIKVKPLKQCQTEYYLYSKNAAQRIFNKDIADLRVYDNCIWLKFYKGDGSPRFVSKQVFKDHFVEWRKANGRKIHARWDNYVEMFKAKSQRFNEEYLIDLLPESVVCSCGDYRKQVHIEIESEAGIKPQCKHVHAVLSYLGMTSIEDYIERQGIEFLDHQEQFSGVSVNLSEQHKEALAEPIN